MRDVAGFCSLVFGWLCVPLLSLNGANQRVLHVSPAPLLGISGKSQYRTISAAARRVRAGDTVLIHSGVYREEVVITANGAPGRPIRFEAAPGERVVITGADEITEWRRESEKQNLFSTRWPHAFNTWNRLGIHPNNDRHALIGRCEQVFIRGYPLRQVMIGQHLARGTFYPDLVGKRLFVWTAGNDDLIKDKVQVEASTRGTLLSAKGNYLQFRGLRFRYAANAAQQGAAKFSGDYQLIEDCIFEKANSVGAQFTGKNLTVRRCVFQENGQLGFLANRAHGLFFSECVVRGNNAKDFDREWEAGANKLVLCRNVVLENSMFVENKGFGIWFDIGNEASEIRNCFISGNDNSGIFYEISYGLHVHDNVIIGNGFGRIPGLWGASAGISISSSPNCVIERNLIVGNKEGINFREQGRKTPRIDDRREWPVWIQNEVIRNNVLAFNRDAQIWGWFDIRDARHWPEAMRHEMIGADFTRLSGRKVKPAAGRRQEYPTDLNLEKLNLTIESNLYWLGPGQGLFNWGTDWKPNRRYRSLNAVVEELNLGRDSTLGDPGFVDYWAMDFRVAAGSPAATLRCYPQGEVPGVRLGIKE